MANYKIKRRRSDKILNTGDFADRNGSKSNDNVAQPLAGLGETDSVESENSISSHTKELVDFYKSLPQEQQVLMRKQATDYLRPFVYSEYFVSKSDFAFMKSSLLLDLT